MRNSEAKLTSSVMSEAIPTQSEPTENNTGIDTCTNIVDSTNNLLQIKVDSIEPLAVTHEYVVNKAIFEEFVPGPTNLFAPSTAVVTAQTCIKHEETDTLSVNEETVQPPLAGIVQENSIHNFSSLEATNQVTVATYAAAAAAAAEAVSTSSSADVDTVAVAAAAAAAVASSTANNVSNDDDFVAAAVAAAAAAAASPSVIDTTTQEALATAAVDAAACVDVAIPDPITLDCSNEFGALDSGKSTSITTVTTSPFPSGLTVLDDRDVIIDLSTGALERKTGLLVYDLIYLHRVMKKLDGDMKLDENSIPPLVDRILNLVENGKSFQLAGIKDVPFPFMKSTGRFLARESNNMYRTLLKEEIESSLIILILHEFSKSDIDDVDNDLYKYMKSILNVSTMDIGNSSVPESNDLIILRCSDHHGDNSYEHHPANKTLLNLASQIVTSFTSTSKNRVDATFAIMKSLQETNSATELKSKVPNFFVHTVETDGSVRWESLSFVRKVELCLIFVFEVFLEKEIDGPRFKDDEETTKGEIFEYKSNSDPIREPTEYDVLFGRGGMTNSHPGNRRFRDIIALHRADYVRAIKMDKPAVARKIVKAIRLGNPPGRFLKKGDDGQWYDVGDRTAAEKTSQGLRERTNTEKRERSALREALRFKKQDSVDEQDSEEKEDVGDNAKEKLAIKSCLPPSQTENTKSLTNINSQLNADTLSFSELNTAGLPPNAVDKNGNILVTDYDILCGRGGLTNHHKGNKRFRDIVALHRSDYVRAPKIQKPSVARVIVRAIRNGDPPGRFLKKDEKTGKWVDVGDKKAAEKTSQALREKTGEEQESEKTTTVSNTTSSGGNLQNSNALLEFDADQLMATISATVASVPSLHRTNNQIIRPTIQHTTSPTNVPDPVAADTEETRKELVASALTIRQLVDTDTHAASKLIAMEGEVSKDEETRLRDSIVNCILDDSVSFIAKSEPV